MIGHSGQSIQQHDETAGTAISIDRQRWTRRGGRVVQYPLRTFLLFSNDVLTWQISQEPDAEIAAQRLFWSASTA
jgi:hypothetical protein